MPNTMFNHGNGRSASSGKMATLQSRFDWKNPKESLNNAEPCWGRGRHAREKTKD